MISRSVLSTWFLMHSCTTTVCLIIVEVFGWTGYSQQTMWEPQECKPSCLHQFKVPSSPSKRGQEHKKSLECPWLMIELDQLEDASNSIIHISNNIGVISKQHPPCRGLRGPIWGLGIHGVYVNSSIATRSQGHKATNYIIAYKWIFQDDWTLESEILN